MRQDLALDITICGIAELTRPQITGDKPLAAAAIAAETGYDLLTQATPEAERKLIREEQAQDKLVAVCGAAPTMRQRWHKLMSVP